MLIVTTFFSWFQWKTLAYCNLWHPSKTTFADIKETKVIVMIFHFQISLFKIDFNGGCLRFYLDITYYWKLKTKNWKCCSKIIFKCVNSTMRPSFKVIFGEKSTCWSRGQCTGPTKKTQPHWETLQTRYPNST